MPVAAPSGENVWNFSPLLEQTDENSQSDTQMILSIAVVLNRIHAFPKKRNENWQTIF